MGNFMIFPPLYRNIQVIIIKINNTGGESFILLGRGRDCTELFESVHALTDTDMNNYIKPYLVPNMPPLDDFFTWEPQGFYSTLKTKLKKHFQGKNYKATNLYWFKVTMLAILAIILFREFYRGSLLGSFFYGAVVKMISFCVLHDGSHGAISKRGWINEKLSIIWNSFVFWGHWLWLQHHIYGHHSYTGIYLKDPDVVHYLPFLRKSEDAPHFSLNRFQDKYWPILVSIWPNQHIGQIMNYQWYYWFGKKLFGMPVTPSPAPLQSLEFWIRTFSFMIHVVIPFFILPFKTAITCQFLVMMAIGLSYWSSVAPNHDSVSTHSSMQGKDPYKMDWGELQVRSSADHTTDNDFMGNAVTHLWGGMNYQIEHHLFPSLNHCHYSAIAPIVKETCQEFNIPYTNHKTWVDAIKSYSKLLSMLKNKKM